jgi:hypothetical protein
MIGKKLLAEKCFLSEEIMAGYGRIRKTKGPDFSGPWHSNSRAYWTLT